MKNFFIIIFFAGLSFQAFSQGLRTSSSKSGTDLDYANPKEYTIGGVNINGVKYLDQSVLITISKLNVGDRILVPGDATSAAVKNLWAQGLFDDVALAINRISGDTVFFDLNLVERPRVSRVQLSGLSKSET